MTAPDQVPTNAREAARLITAVVELMMQSNLHKHYSILGAGQRVLQPLENGQFRLYAKNDKPFAFVSWAFVDEAREKKILDFEENLTPEEWNCGEALWLMEWVVPNGGEEEILEDLTSRLSEHKSAKRLRINAEEESVEVLEIAFA